MTTTTTKLAVDSAKIIGQSPRWLFNGCIQQLHTKPPISGLQPNTPSFHDFLIPIPGYGHFSFEDSFSLFWQHTPGSIYTGSARFPSRKKEEEICRFRLQSTVLTFYGQVRTFATSGRHFDQRSFQMWSAASGQGKVFFAFLEDKMCPWNPKTLVSDRARKLCVFGSRFWFRFKILKWFRIHMLRKQEKTSKVLPTVENIMAAFRQIRNKKQKPNFCPTCLRVCLLLEVCEGACC